VRNCWTAEQRLRLGSNRYRGRRRHAIASSAADSYAYSNSDTFSVRNDPIPNRDHLADCNGNSHSNSNSYSDTNRYGKRYCYGNR
jgi:hypothetical protein